MVEVESWKLLPSLWPHPADAIVAHAPVTEPAEALAAAAMSEPERLFPGLPDDLRAHVVKVASALTLIVISQLDRRCRALAAPRIRCLAKLRDPPFAMAPALIFGEDEAASKMELRSQWLGAAGVATLAAAAQCGATENLIRLDLEDNKLWDKGAAAFAAAVGAGALVSLQTLRLPRNKLGDAGMLALASAIGEGRIRSLRTLSLGINRIGDAGAVALAEAMGKGALVSLESINLSTNLVADRGVLALCTGPWRTKATMTRLETLWLDNNGIGAAGCAALEGVLESGALVAIEDIYLENNIGSGLGIEEALAHRKWQRETLAGGKILKWV